MNGTAAEDDQAGAGPTDDDPLWIEAVRFPPGLARRLNALVAETGPVDPAATIVGPVTLGEAGAH